MNMGLVCQNDCAVVAPKLEDLVERYYRSLFQFALSLTGCEADAWDLTQQTFYTWTTKGAQLRDASKVRCWLYTTLHRAFLRVRRRAIRFPHYELSQVDCDLPRTLPQDASKIDGMAALDALSKVDEIFRAPLTLFYLEDYSYNEIAIALKVPLGTVKSRIARGIRQLQRLLTDDAIERIPAAALG
jgi:RNA polymerase sigma-70 factor (ECF subfamily)